jgi:hypothetical protein
VTQFTDITNAFFLILKMSCSFVVYAKYKIEKNEMGGACGANGGGERFAQGSGGET